MKITICQACRHAVEIGWKFCGGCGHKLCPQCGHLDGRAPTTERPLVKTNEARSVHTSSFAGKADDGYWWCRTCNKHEMAGPCR